MEGGRLARRWVVGTKTLNRDLLFWSFTSMYVVGSQDLEYADARSICSSDGRTPV
jgi:hypothetical protein